MDSNVQGTIDEHPGMWLNPVTRRYISNASRTYHKLQHQLRVADAGMQGRGPVRPRTRAPEPPRRRAPQEQREYDEDTGSTEDVLMFEERKLPPRPVIHVRVPSPRVFAPVKPPSPPSASSIAAPSAVPSVFQPLRSPPVAVPALPSAPPVLTPKSAQAERVRRFWSKNGF
jgi:hypothetical protein